jgi:hypothetical protein
MLHLMAGRHAPAHSGGMRSVLRSATRREADNELYDRACELVEAAAAIRRSAGRPEAVRAAPAVLGCVHEAIGELSLACVALERGVAGAAQARAPIGDDRRRRVIERMHRGFGSLSAALNDAQRATGASRALVARALSLD